MTPHENLRQQYTTIQALQKSLSVLQWDRQTMMPARGASARTTHVGQLTRLAHELLTGDEFQRALEAAEAEAAPGSDEAAEVRVLKREVRTQTRIPKALVMEKARVSSDAYEVWKVAREAGTFAPMASFYEQLFDIAGRTAEALGYTDHIYDPLIDLFEEGATYADARRMFDTIQKPITDLVDRIGEADSIDDTSLDGPWDNERVRALMQRICAQIGFSFEAGRLDVAPNAFCSNFSVGDVRMTTRPASHIKGIVFSSLHEMGHGLYEQLSPAEWDGTPLCGGISLGIHESQSRLWENIVGRSEAFWNWAAVPFEEAFSSLEDTDANTLFRAVNKVEPGLVRIGSDELTYNLHIQVRFELECEVLRGKVKASELPEAWNAKYAAYLGVTPPHDGLGVLQDVHWSRGSIGYFPTYAMGNLIGGQVWERLSADIPDVDAQMAEGRFEAPLGWLTERIYSQGKRFTPKELLQRVVGGPMDAQPWLAYAERKFGALYGL